MRKLYWKLKLEKRGKIVLEKTEKIEIQNRLKKYFNYLKELALRRTTISYEKKYAKHGSILI